MKSIIYTPRDRADEYAREPDYPDDPPLACNLGTGCTFACMYCYACDTLRIPREKFHAGWTPKKDALLRFEADCRKLQKRGNKAPIFLEFTSDPCMSEQKAAYTIAAIHLAHQNGQRVNVLTKGGKYTLTVIDEMKDGDIFGVTLTCTKPLDEWHWEPESPSGVLRAGALQYAHEKGLETRASFEPVLFPGQTLELVEQVRPITTLIQVGKLNTPRTAVSEVRERERAIDWPRFRADVTALLDGLGGEWMMKRDLAEASPPNGRG